MKSPDVARRPYRMAVRAESAAATRRAIGAAFLELFASSAYDALTLDAVAARAGVSVQTVIRHFGSKDELFAAVSGEVAEVESARRADVPADPAAAIAGLVDHYERIGDTVMRILAQEDRFPRIHELAERGRGVHARWVERAFGPFLEATPKADRRRRRAQLAALTDVYVWKLLRRDQRLSRRQTEIAMTEAVTALIAGGT
jgi:AcrR family transcriptional regulator